jgi:pre-rRNA-processing protein TSR1
LQVALIVENEVDTLAGEQTWPTEEEMADAAKQQSEDRDNSMKRVPKGTSTYQVCAHLAHHPYTS